MTLSTMQMVGAEIAGACVMFIILLYTMFTVKDQKRIDLVFTVCGVGFIMYAVFILAYSIW